MMRRRLAAVVVVAFVVVGWAGGDAAPPVGATTVRVVSHGSRTRPEIALTFDDGISPANCRRILATLVEDGVPATFFPIGEAISLDPPFWRLVAQAGDPVGDHTWSHPQMPTLAVAEQVAQIERARKAVEAATGQPILRVFRPPYGAYDAATLDAASRAGFDTVLQWDTSDRDTSPRGTVAEMVKAAEAGTNGSVILMHCGPNPTPWLLPQVIADYRARGFDFVTVPKLLGMAWSPGPTASLTPAQILDGLPSLPPTQTGGPVTGPNGYALPSATPSSTPSATPSPRATPTPASSATPRPTPTAHPSSRVSPSPYSPSPSSPSTGPSPSAAPVGSPPPTPVAGPSSAVATTGDTTELIALGILVLLVLALGLVLALRRGRVGGTR
jgi:peptidoglycan/xylan/chitin deacetylase (PgdA/CDA1 family)